MSALWSQVLLKYRNTKNYPVSVLDAKVSNHSLAHCPCAPNEINCSKCSGCHSNTENNPCLEAPKCGNCSEAHVSYNMNCPSDQTSSELYSKMNQATILSFASLNINGTKDKDLLINELLVHDIVFLQETLLTKSNVSGLKRPSVHHFFFRKRPGKLEATLPVV